MNQGYWHVIVTKLIGANSSHGSSYNQKVFETKKMKPCLPMGLPQHTKFKMKLIFICSRLLKI